MRKITSIFLAGFFILGLSCRLAGSSRQGYIVYSAIGKDGEPLPELVVLDANGKELRRITLPAEQGSGGNYLNYPFIHPSHRAFVYSLDGAHYLVNVVSGEVKPIQVAEKDAIQNRPTPLNLCPISGYGERYWALLCYDNNAYLVNLETADVYADLLSKPGDQVFPGDTLFSPDETYLALHTQDWISILPTADPGKIRHLGESNKIKSISFSTDNKRIAYVRSLDSQNYAVIVENRDGSGSSIVLVSKEWAQVTFVPGQDQILVQEKNKILLLSLSGRAKLEFPILPGKSRTPMFSPNGEWAWIGYMNTDTSNENWQRLDLKHGFAEEIPELEGYKEMQVFPGQRYIILYQSTQLDAQAEIHMMNVDLQTSSVQSLATLEGAKYYREISVSADGIYHTGIAFTTEDLAEFWFMDLADGEARKIANDAVVSGGISPDGKRLVVLSEHREGEQHKSTIVLQDAAGKKLKSLGDGYSPFWVWP